MEGLIGYFILLLLITLIFTHEFFVEIGISIVCRKKHVCTNKSCHFRGYCEKAWRGNKPSGPPREVPWRKNNENATGKTVTDKK